MDRPLGVILKKKAARLEAGPKEKNAANAESFRF
jgi:hypothetical protein